MQTKEWNNEEREIDLVKLLWDALEQWKPILLVALLCGCLVSGVMYIRSGISYRSAVAITNEIDDPAELLEDEERTAVEQNILKKKNLMEKEDYLAKSVYLTLDAENERYLSVLYRVSASGSARQAAVLYRSYLESDDFYEAIADSLGESGKDSRYIRELTVISLDGGSVLSDSGSGAFYAITSENQVVRQAIDNEEASAAFLTVEVLLPEDVEAYDVEKAIDAYIQDCSKEITASLDHQIEAVNSQENTRIDQALTTARTGAIDAVASLSSTVTTAEDGFSDNQKAYYESLLKEYDMEDEDDGVKGNASDTTETASRAAEEEEAVLAPPTFSKKYFAIGCLAGIVLYGGLMLLFEIFKKTFSAANEAEAMYGLRVLDDIHRREYKGTWEKFIHSQRIYHLRYKNEEKDMVKRIRNIQDSVEDYVAHKELGKEVCFVPVGWDGSSFPGAAIESTEAVCEGDLAPVVYVLKAGVSTYRELQERLTAAVDFDRVVLGVVGIEE